MAEMTADNLSAMFKEEFGKVKAEMREEHIKFTEEIKSKVADPAVVEKVGRDYTDGLVGSGAGINVEAMATKVREERLSKMHRMAKIGAISRLMVLGKGDEGRALDIAKREKSDPAVIKSLQQSLSGSGGSFVDTPLSNESIEFLRDEGTMRSLGARVINVPNGSVTFPRLVTGSTAVNTGEGDQENATQPTTGSIRLEVKKRSAHIPVSNDLLEDSDFTISSMIGDDVGDALVELEDLDMIRGDGLADKILGVKGIVDGFQSSHSFTRAQAASVSTTAEKIADLCKAMRLPRSAKVRERAGGWIMTARSKFDIMCLREGDGAFLFRTEVEGGRIFGHPFKTTEQIPETLLAGDETEIYFIDFGYVVIGDQRQLKITQHDGATYPDSSGTLVSALAADESVIKATSRTGMILRHLGKEASIITAVDWGV